uniref:Uncharacterized protein n=1 Tax=Compsopogon caeruleus TaxID=31354 RepID=A0A7S1XGG0_9RHOD
MWEESASQIIREWGSQSISTVVQSFSRLGSPTLPFMEAVLTRILTIGFEKLSIIELVNVMYGVSRWTTNRGKRWDEHTWHELSDEISRKLGEASPETLGFLASALINHACISQETCSVLRTRWLSELFVQMDRCSVEQLAHIPLQIARLGVEIPSDGFFRKFYRLFEQKASGFGSVELATMFYWLGRISAKPTNRFLKTWSDRAITAFRPFDEMIFVNSIRAFSLLRRQPDHIFFDFWLREMSQNLGQNSSNAGLALAISSLGKLRLTPGKEFVEAWTRAFESSNREWKAQEYFMMLEGWSKLGMAPPESLLNQIFQFYPEKFLQGSIDSPMLAGILHALGLLDRCPPAEFLSSWCSAASHDGSRFTNQEVSNIVYAFGTLGIAVPKQLFEVEHLQQVARGGSNQEYAVLIHGVAKLSRLAPIPNKGPVLDVSPLLSEFAEIGRKRQATLTLREVLHIGSSFGTEAKRNRLPNFVEDSLFQILRRDMLRLEPKALVSCSHVLGLIGPRVPSELMANWLSRLESHLDTFTSKELSNCILSASSSSFTPSSTFLSRWQFAFQRHSTMKNFDLWMSIEAIYRLRLAPSEDFRSSFFGHLLTNGFTGEKRGRLLHLGHILREMDMPVPQEVAQKWVKSVYELSPPMSTPVQDLPDILRMCNCCGSMTSIVAEYYAKTELILNGLGNLSLSDFVLALEAFGEIHTAIDHNSKIRLSEGIRSQGTRHWQLMDSQQLLSAFRSIVRVDHDFDWLEFWKMTADCLGSLNREEIETFLALANSAGVKAPFALVVRQQYLALETAGNASCPIEVPQSIPSAVPQTDQQRSLEGPAALSQGPLL